jgi:hypothetical protein
VSVFLTNLRRETLRREQATVRAVTNGRLLTWAELFTELGEIGGRDASPLRTVAALRKILTRLAAVPYRDCAHVMMTFNRDRGRGRRTLDAAVLNVVVGNHPLVGAETNCLIAYGGWLRTTRRETSVLGGLPLAVLGPHAITRLAERSRDYERLDCLAAPARQAGHRAFRRRLCAGRRPHFLMRIEDTVFAGATRLVGTGDAMANWCIDIRTVLAPDMLSLAELRQAEATGDVLMAVASGQIEQAYAATKALPIIPARARDFIAGNAKQIAVGRRPASIGTEATGGHPR